MVTIEVLSCDYPPRDVELIRTEIDMEAPCSMCRKRRGVITCQKCKAVKFCSEECRTKEIPNHEDNCHRIFMYIKETMQTLETLGKDFKCDLVADKRKLALEISKDPVTLHKRQFFIAKKALINGYQIVGHESSSPMAFKLASENDLDMLRGFNGPKLYYAPLCCSLIACGMDQVAANILMHLRNWKDQRDRPYAEILRQDVDIEDSKCVQSFLEDKQLENYNGYDFFLRWPHWAMMMALIKYRRLQAVFLERRKLEIRLRTFLMGTHPEVGRDSPVQAIRANYVVLDNIAKALTKDINSRIEALIRDIAKILSNVGIDTIGALKTRAEYFGDYTKAIRSNEQPPPDEQEREDLQWYHDWVVDSWKMSESYLNILDTFLHAKCVLDPSDNDDLPPWSILARPGSKHFPKYPREGFKQLAFDLDPTRSTDDAPDLELFPGELDRTEAEKEDPLLKKLYQERDEEEDDEDMVLSD